MAAHLAGHLRADFFHLGLDQRVADFPHQRIAAVRANVVKQDLRALHFGNELRARMFFENGARKDDHQLIAPDHATVFVNYADAVAVAVKGYRQVGLVFGNRINRKAHVFDDRRVGVMIRKAAVRFAEEFNHVAAHRLVKRSADHSAHAVAAVNDDLQTARPELDVRGDHVAVLIQ